MPKKRWIYIKRGLSEDPKHRERMGMGVWLFMHICDACDWETGIVYDWRDKEVAIDMTLSTATVRAWRDRLSDSGYITCVQKQRGLEIIVHNWNNPREYNSPKMNVRKGDMDVSPCDEEEKPDSAQGDTEVDTQVPDETRVDGDSFIESESLSLSLSGVEKKILFWNGRDLSLCWVTVCEHLRTEMPRASQYRLDSCTPIAWDEATFTLTIQAENPDWLNDRIAKTASRMLMGLLNVNDPKIVFCEKGGHHD